MLKIFRSITSLLLIVAGLCAVYSLTMVHQKEFKKTVEAYTLDIKDTKTFSCTTKLGATLFAKLDSDKNTFKKMDGSLFESEGTKLAISVDGNTLKMLSDVSVGVGVMEPAKFIIIRETNDQIVAVDTESDIPVDPGVGTFVLNRKTGTAIWTKAKPAFWGTDMPDGQVYFLECR